MNFLSKEGEDENEIWMKFYKDLNELETAGRWSMELADVLPLALADFSETQVRIYSSKQNVPVIDFNISKGTTDSDKGSPIIIVLAYPAPPGIAEHYDTCSKCENEISNNTATHGYSDKPMSDENDEKCSDKVNTPKKQTIYLTPEKKRSAKKKKSNTRKLEKKM